MPLPLREMEGVRMLAEPGFDRRLEPGAKAAESMRSGRSRLRLLVEWRLKRLMDVVGAGIGLVVLAPFITLIAIAIRLDSPGPAIFKQTRVGKGGRRFTFYKFRSMYEDSDAGVHEQYTARLIAGEDLDNLMGDNGSFKLEHDSRITRVGRLLRRTSLDELPQLANVLLGQMSLIGPRPPLEYEVAKYKEPHLRRLEVLPGMTGLWQVSGRTKTSFEEMVELDVAYVDNWSFTLDLRILARTPFVVFNREGAW
ncbi:MAG: sugar transferase [Actinobacteria bacterium]|nr:MAG: sugar transferase [Actinomycetota bacterium]